MKLNFNECLKNFDGKPIREGEGEDAIDITLGLVAQRALGVAGGEEKISGEEKFRRFRLGVKIATAMADTLGIGEVTVEEIATIKRTIGEVFPPVITGSAWTIIEDAGKAPAKVKKNGATAEATATA